MTDDHIRSEAEIADLAPYVPQSAIDAVRDAFRKIVLENQDHSALLDKLLPELRQMPSKRSQALDWLDVELARLSDDRVIALIDRLKRARSDGWQFERETRTVVRSRNRRRLWPMVGAVAAMFMMMTYGWAGAHQEARLDRERANALEKRVIDLTRSTEAREVIKTMIETLAERDVRNRAAWIVETEKLIQLWNQIEGKTDGRDKDGTALKEPGSPGG